MQTSDLSYSFDVEKDDVKMLRSTTNKRSRTASLIGMLMPMRSAAIRRRDSTSSSSSIPQVEDSGDEESPDNEQLGVMDEESVDSSSTMINRIDINSGPEVDYNNTKVLSSCSSSVDEGKRCEEEEDTEEESCFICLGGFTRKQPATRLPCANKCNLSPVHGKCIYEWSECKQSTTSSCPLCRGPLEQVTYIPRDRIGSHRFQDFDTRKNFIVHPVPKSAGVVRCYVRAVRQGYLGTSMRYELYLQAPTTLKYPLGPLPSLDKKKNGDILLAVSHKHVNRWGCTQLDITMDHNGKDFHVASNNYLGCIYSSFTGLEHTLVAPHHQNKNNDNSSSDKKKKKKNNTNIFDEDDETKVDMCELGAVRYTQNRIGRSVGPRRIHVCFPKIIKTIGPINSSSSSSSSSSSNDRTSVFPHPTTSDDKSSSRKEEDNLFGGIGMEFEDSDSDDDDDNEEEQDQQQQNQRVEEEEEEEENNKTLPRPPSGWSTVAYKPARKHQSLSAVLRNASQGGETAKTNDEHMFGTNKTPYWLPAISAFSLDFGGRVTLPSNKNFQLIMNNDGQDQQQQQNQEQEQQQQQNQDVSLQFGKVAESQDLEIFTLDVSWPLSPLQAFGVCLSACDRKLLCA